MIHIFFFFCLNIIFWSIMMDIVNDSDLKKVFDTKSKWKNLLRITIWPIVMIMYYRKRR